MGRPRRDIAVRGQDGPKRFDRLASRQSNFVRSQSGVYLFGGYRHLSAHRCS
jgi:hypothetical protein